MRIIKRYLIKQKINKARSNIQSYKKLEKIIMDEYDTSVESVKTKLMFIKTMKRIEILRILNFYEELEWLVKK